MMGMKEYFLERGELKIHYWLGGNPNAPLVVFTHGATVDHHEWDASLPLAAERFRVLAWDVRGHGLSRPAVFNFQESVLDLAALLDRVGAGEAILVGHSMGGNLHQEFAFQFPQRARAMVCLDCTWNFQRLTSLEKFSLASAKPLFNFYPYETLIRQSLDVTVSSPAARETLSKAMHLLSKEEFVQIMLETAKCLHEEPGYQYGKPLLLMVGEHDQTGNIRKIMPIWAKQEPESQFHFIPNAKHAANLDNPDFFHEKLMAFLDSVRK